MQIKLLETPEEEAVSVGLGAEVPGDGVTDLYV